MARLHRYRLSPGLIGAVLAACAISAGCARGSGAPAPPAVSGPSGALDLIARGQAQGTLHGIAAVIDADGRVTRLANGREVQPDGAIVTPSSKFRLGSLTKLFTQLAILRLVEQGRLELDAPLSRYRQGLAAPWADEVTVRDLLAFRSGLPRERGDMPETSGVELDDDGFALAFLDGLVEPGPSVPPGQQTLYSNLGYMHLGGVIEAVTGAPLPDAMRTLVLAPLGLSATGFGADILGADGHVRGHEVRADGTIEVIPDYPVSPRHAAGGMYGSLGDLEIVTAAILEGSLLSPASTDELFTQFGRPGASDPAYFEAAGHVPGFANAWVVSRSPRAAVILLNNAVGGSPKAVIDTLRDAGAAMGCGADDAGESATAAAQRLAADGWIEVTSIDEVPDHAVLPHARALLDALASGDYEQLLGVNVAMHGLDLDALSESTRGELGKSVRYELDVSERYGPFTLRAWRLGERGALELYLQGPDGRAVRYGFAESAKRPGGVGEKSHATVGFSPE